MGELTSYLGNEYMKFIFDKASQNSQEFIKQTGATKLKLADAIKVEVEAYKLATNVLLDTLDDAGAKIELDSKTLKAYEKEYGITNEEFIKNQKITVIKSDERNHAKNLLKVHLKKNYNTQLKQEKAPK